MAVERRQSTATVVLRVGTYLANPDHAPMPSDAELCHFVAFASQIREVLEQFGQSERLHCTAAEWLRGHGCQVEPIGEDEGDIYR